MDRKIQSLKKNLAAPDYRKIYTDMIEMKYQEKKESCKALLDRPNISFLEIIEIERKLMGVNISDPEDNGKFRAYDDKAIIQILKYQKKNRLTNIDLSREFKISRNSIAKWKKMFVEI